MQGVWQLVRILTVLSVACIPPWQVVICALKGFHWFPQAPLMGVLKLYLRAQQWGTPKLLVLIAQKHSSPDSGMWSPLGSQQARIRDESLPLFSCSECALRTPTRLMSVRFCSAPDHTRTLVHKHCKPHIRLSTLPNTHRHTLFFFFFCHSHSHTKSPMRCENFSKHPKLCVRNDEKWLAFMEELYRAALLTALVATSNSASGGFLKDVSLSSILPHLVYVKEIERRVEKSLRGKAIFSEWSNGNTKLSLL